MLPKTSEDFESPLLSISSLEWAIAYSFFELTGESKLSRKNTIWEPLMRSYLHDTMGLSSEDASNAAQYYLYGAQQANLPESVVQFIDRCKAETQVAGEVFLDDEETCHSFERITFSDGTTKILAIPVHAHFTREGRRQSSLKITCNAHGAVFVRKVDEMDVSRSLEPNHSLEAHALLGRLHGSYTRVREGDIGEEPTVKRTTYQSLYKCGSLREMLDLITSHFDAPSTRHIIKLLIEVCDQLEILHQAGILHLDIKPLNIMLDSEVEPGQASAFTVDAVSAQLIDFDNVKKLPLGCTQARFSYFGTEGYADPYFQDTGIAGFWSDIYSLGCVMKTIAEATYDELLLSFAKQMCQYQPERRPTLQSVRARLFDMYTHYDEADAFEFSVEELFDPAYAFTHGLGDEPRERTPMGGRTPNLNLLLQADSPSTHASFSAVRTPCYTPSFSISESLREATLSESTEQRLAVFLDTPLFNEDERVIPTP